ncbi:hypothetical protein [Bradyrhizobium sp. McL0615]|uniref:hypothetical protein n=1 Tax=Bradyrhizobium sp. McL0615 TaxID=3415673 RepID=UPI003CF3384D
MDDGGLIPLVSDARKIEAMHSTKKPTPATGMTGAEFLSRLFKPGTPIFLASFANDRAEKKKFPPRDRVITDPARVAKFVAQFDVPGRACYFACNEMTGLVRDKDHVAQIGMLFTDLDFKGIVENQKKIEAVIRNLELKPTASVFSGNGLHLYWRLAKPLPPESTPSTEDIMRRICAVLAGDVAAAEVARVPRLPGSHNSKNGEWKPVEVIDELSSWKTYDVAALDRWSTNSEPLLTYKPTKRDEAKANAAPLNAFQEAYYKLRHRTGGFDIDGALDDMEYKSARGNGIDATITKVVGAMVAEGRSLQACLQVILGEAKRAYERGRGAGAPPWNEQEEIKNIREKFNRLTRRDANKPKKSAPVINMQDEAPAEQPKAKPGEKKIHEFESDPPEKPVFTVAGGELSTLATHGEKTLMRAREPIYQRGGALVRPIISEVDAAHGRTTKICELKEIDAHYLRDRLTQVAIWQRLDGRSNETVAVNPPLEIAQTILARGGHWSFPALAGVITTPTMRPDGSLLTKPGYDKATRLLLSEPPELPEMPEKPTKKDAEAALAKLRTLIAEFPFIDAVAEAVALSGLITPIVRGAFNNTPMHIARASTPGSGKSFLFDTVSAIAMGFPMAVIAAGRTEEETEKRLGAALLCARSLVALDNVNGELGGDALCQIIERPVVEVRRLGHSELTRIEARGTTCFATGNNLTVVGDLTRRVLISTLDSKLERPELRKFKGNPYKAVMADRGAYIAACLTICRAYHLAGRPKKAKPLGSFEGWSDCVRSALMWLGTADPVTSMELARAEDPKLTQLRDVLKAWEAVYGKGSAKCVTLARVIRDASQEWGGVGPEHPELHDAIDAVAGWRGPADIVKLSAWCKKHKGRLVDGLQLMVRSNPKGGSLWWVEAAAK